MLCSARNNRRNLETGSIVLEKAEHEYEQHTSPSKRARGHQKAQEKSSQERKYIAKREK